MSPVDTTTNNSKIRKYHFLLSLIILGICISYALVFAYQSRRTGLTFSQGYYVSNTDLCTNNVVGCGDPATSIQPGDRLLSIAEHELPEPEESALLQAMINHEKDGLVPVTVLRENEILTFEHRLVEINLREGLGATAVALIISLPYWFVATAVLVYMVPHDDKWFLLILFFYLAAIWLSIGINSASGWAYSRQLTRVLAWLMIPTIIHLHLTAPSRIINKTFPIWLILFYSLCVAMAGAEFLVEVPGSAYLYVFVLAIIVSILILIHRSFFKPPSAYRLTSRFMLTGLVLAPGMAIILWATPVIFGSVASGTATNLSLLAMPAMPLFYGYALYKHQLGRQESRFNRFLAMYSAFLVYLSLLIVAFNYARPELGISSDLLLFTSVIVVALLLALMPLRDLIFSVVNRLAYGKKYDRQEIVNNFSSRINEISGQEHITNLLLQVLLPTLNVEESSLILVGETQGRILYQFELKMEDFAIDPELIERLEQTSEIYLATKEEGGNPLSETLSWMRLIIPLKVRGNLIGFWFFGRRRPDNYYNSDDIQLLMNLGSQLAMKLFNDNLYRSLQQELAERRIAEIKLASLSERLQLINDIDQSILSARSAREIAQVTLTKLTNLIPFDRASVVLFDIPNKQMELLAIYDIHIVPQDGTPTRKIPLAHAPSQFTDGNTWIVEDASDVDLESVAFDALASENIRSIMSTPLLVYGRLIGALNLLARTPGTLSSEFQMIAEEVANSIAITIYNTRLRETLEQHRIDLKKLSSELIDAQENERKRISYELHDEMGQLLTAITFNLAAIEKELNTTTSPQLEMKLLDTRMIVEHLMHQVRDLSLELRPAMLQDLGLEPTVRWYVNTVASRYDIEIQLETINIDGRYSESIEIGLYRIIQEALTNVSKHSSASKVQLCLERRNSQIHLQIDDDGQGFDVEKVLAASTGMKGVGLVAIRERTASLNGKIRILSQPGKGTQLVIDIPLEKS